MFFIPARAATVEGAQARHQFGERKGFDQVVVSPQLKAFDAVGDVIAGGEEQHRGIGFFTQAAQHFPAIHFRHHHVEYDHVERRLQGLVQTVHAIAGQAHAMPQFLQAIEQIIAGLGFVFDYKDVHGKCSASISCASVARSIVIGATGALDLVIQHMFAVLVVQVAQLRWHNPALAVGVGAREHLGDIQMDEEAGFVMDHVGSRGGVGSEYRASDEQSGEA